MLNYIAFINEINAYVLATLGEKEEVKRLYTDILTRLGNAYLVSLRHAEARMKVLKSN